MTGSSSARTVLKAEALSQPGLPLEISNVSARSDVVTRETWVHFTITNRGTEPLHEASYLAILFGQKGNVRGGQTSCENIGLAPGQRLDRELRLGNRLFVPPGQGNVRVALGVESVRGEFFSWTAASSPSDLLSAMSTGEPLSAGAVSMTAITTAAEQPSKPCADDFCSNCQQSAITVCGSAGVKSFNCTIGTTACTCSFECREPRDRGPGDVLP
jgi:hypothetical protein